MVTVDDIGALVKTRLAAVTGQATTCPGGHWFDRGPDVPDAYPYDVYRVKAGRTGLTTGSLCIQTFIVDLVGYCPIGESGVNPQSVEQLFHTALVSDAAQTALLAYSLRNLTEKVLCGRVVQSEGKFDPDLRDAKDVFAPSLTVEIIVQSDRSVA